MRYIGGGIGHSVISPKQSTGEDIEVDDDPEAAREDEDILDYDEEDDEEEDLDEEGNDDEEDEDGSEDELGPEDGEGLIATRRMTALRIFRFRKDSWTSL